MCIFVDKYMWLFIIFIIALFVLTKNWKQPKCPSIGDWLEKEKCITIEYNAAETKYEEAVKYWYGMFSNLSEKNQDTIISYYLH